MSQSYLHLVLVNFPTFFTSKLAHLTCFGWQAMVYALWQEEPKLVYAFWSLLPVGFRGDIILGRYAKDRPNALCLFTSYMCPSTMYVHIKGPSINVDIFFYDNSYHNSLTPSLPPLTIVKNFDLRHMR